MTDTGYQIITLPFDQNELENRINQRAIFPYAVQNNLLAEGSVGTLNIQNAAITNAKIASLTWDKGQGGTLTLGGSANGNGTLALLDSTGATKITADNTGLTITSGKITIQNDSNSTTIDSKGVVGSANFITANSVSAYTGSSLQTISSSSYTDITSASVTFTLSRATFVLVMADLLTDTTVDGTSAFWAREFIGINADSSVVQENVSDARHASSPANDNWGASNAILPQHLHYFASLSATTHTIKLQGKVTQVSGTGASLSIWGYRLTYIIFGT